MVKSVSLLLILTGIILLIPLVAMQFTAEVSWSLFDFIVMGILLFATGLAYILLSRISATTSYRTAAGVALIAAFILIWMSLGVGIIGKDGDPANLMYFAVVATGISGAFIARFHSRGMVRALFATAIAQILVTVITIINKFGYPWSTAAEILVLNGFFIVLFIVSALLFRRAAKQEKAA